MVGLEPRGTNTLPLATGKVECWNCALCSALLGSAPIPAASIAGLIRFSSGMSFCTARTCRSDPWD